MKAPLNQQEYVEEVVAEGEARIARQVALVHRLEQRGQWQEARMARELLATITETVQAISIGLYKKTAAPARIAKPPKRRRRIPMDRR